VLHRHVERNARDAHALTRTDLAVINGIALDKIAKQENWGRVDHNPGAAAGSLLSKLAELEGKLKLEITVERTPADEWETTQRAKRGTLSARSTSPAAARPDARSNQREGRCFEHQG